MELANLKLSCHEPSGNLCSPLNKLQSQRSMISSFFNGAWHCGWVRSRWRKCHVIVERATLLRAGCSLHLLGKDWECQPLTTCRPCWTRSLPHPASHSQIFPKHVGLHAEKRQKRKQKLWQPWKYKDWPLEKQSTQGICISGYTVYGIRFNTN